MADNKSMRYNLISVFFKDPQEYIEFLIGKKTITIANADGSCMADLTKTTNNFWTYTLIWTDNKKFISEFIRPFRASLENIHKFNNGCRIFARRLKIYLETNDPSNVPTEPVAFGDLVYEFPICPLPKIWNNIYQKLILEQQNRDIPNEPPKPLILDGWHYSNDADKKDRWMSTIYWIMDNIPNPKILDEIKENDYYKGQMNS